MVVVVVVIAVVVVVVVTVVVIVVVVVVVVVLQHSTYLDCLPEFFLGRKILKGKLVHAIWPSYLLEISLQDHGDGPLVFRVLEGSEPLNILLVCQEVPAFLQGHLW